MNGKLAKRIRRASAICGRSADQLKREYMALPYHQRAKPQESHSFVLRRRHSLHFLP